MQLSILKSHEFEVRRRGNPYTQKIKKRKVLIPVKLLSLMLA